LLFKAIKGTPQLKEFGGDTMSNKALSQNNMKTGDGEAASKP